MRPITDKLRISREKLAYIVDSTAAPVASVSPISTWIGYEIGLIGAAFAAIGLDWSPYTAFLASIPYRFYPLLALVLGFTIAATRKDLGPMHKAEQRAAADRRAGARGRQAAVRRLERPAERRPRARRSGRSTPCCRSSPSSASPCWASTAPARRGWSGPPSTRSIDWLRQVFSDADSYAALLWASLVRAHRGPGPGAGAEAALGTRGHGGDGQRLPGDAHGAGHPGAGLVDRLDLRPAAHRRLRRSG